MTTPLYPYKYNCKLCDYNTNRLSQINKHFTTRKHIMTTHGLPTCNNDYIVYVAKNSVVVKTFIVIKKRAAFNLIVKRRNI
jgi:hypothetical protein